MRVTHTSTSVVPVARSPSFDRDDEARDDASRVSPDCPVLAHLVIRSRLDRHRKACTRPTVALALGVLCLRMLSARLAISLDSPEMRFAPFAARHESDGM